MSEDTMVALAAHLFKGLFIPICGWGDDDDDPQFGEILFHFGEMYERNSDTYDDEYILYRGGREEPFSIATGNGLYFEAFPEIKVGSKEWKAWLAWCLQEFETFE